MHLTPPPAGWAPSLTANTGITLSFAIGDSTYAMRLEGRLVLSIEPGTGAYSISVQLDPKCHPSIHQSST